MENQKSRLLEHRKLIKGRKPIFVRTDSHKISNLGMRRKKKQVWRNARGRHNKIREKKNGRRQMPSVGFSSPRQIRGTIDGFIPILINNVKELERVARENIIIIGSVGLRKKVEIMKKADELKLNILINRKKLLEKAERRIAEIGKNKQTKAQEKKKEEKKEDKSQDKIKEEDKKPEETNKEQSQSENNQAKETNKPGEIK